MQAASSSLSSQLWGTSWQMRAQTSCSSAMDRSPRVCTVCFCLSINHIEWRCTRAVDTMSASAVSLSPHAMCACQVDDEERVTLIDFPQMVSVAHRNARM